MTHDIARATELFLVAGLKQNLIGHEGHQILPLRGGSDTEDAAEIEPPATIVAMGSPEKMYAQENTWTIRGTVQVVSHRSNMTVESYSDLVRAIYAALLKIRPSCSDPAFSFHGLDISGMRQADDSEGQLHAEIIEIVAGVGG